MLSLNEIIKKRRSIRKYLEEEPEPGLIEKLIKISSYTASPSNIEPVRFIQIVSKEKKESLKNEINNGYESLLSKIENIENNKRSKNRINSYWRYSNFMFDAPVLFAVGYEKSKRTFSNFLDENGLSAVGEYERYSYNITVGLYLQNFMLKSVEMGLDTCILTAPLLFIQNINQVLNIDNIKISCFLTLGYSDDKPDEKLVKPVDQLLWRI